MIATVKLPSLGRRLRAGSDQPLSHSMVSAGGVGSPGVQVAGPYPSLVRVKRRGDNQKVATFSVPRPAPGHSWCMLSAGRNERVVKRKPWGQAPGPVSLLSPIFLGVSSLSLPAGLVGGLKIP